MKAMKAILISLTLGLFAGLLQAEDSPVNVAGATSIDAAKAKALFDSGALFVDTRSNSDWDAGRIPGAVHLELKTAYTADSLSAEAAKDEAIVMYCNGVSCLRSSDATAKAVSWGFTNVYYYRLGFPDWKAKGYPVE